MARFALETPTQQLVFGFALAFAILPTLFVLLRIFAHRLARRKLDASDYCIIAACVFIVGLETCSITAVLNCGVGYHVSDIVAVHGPAPLTEFAQLLVALQILWALSLSFCKISMLLLYTRIFSVPGLIVAARLTTGLIILWATATILASFFICQPFAFNWDKSIPGGSCGNQVLSFQITGALNIITDLMVLVLPIPVLIKLRKPVHQRITLLAIFSLGLLTCVVSAVRLAALVTMDYSDVTFTVPKSNILSGLEPSVAIILSCTLLLRPLTMREFYPWGGTNTGSHHGAVQRLPGHSGSGSAQYESKINSSRESRMKTQSRDFERLDRASADDSSEMHLHPLTREHTRE